MTDKTPYVPRPHLIRSHPRWIFVNRPGVEPNLHLKLYTMVPDGQPDFKHGDLGELRNLMEIMAQGNGLPRTLGLGFSIVSEGMLNVCTWGGKYPSLLHQRQYGFDHKDIPHTFTPLDPTLEGLFCCWELGVVAHEGKAWRKYLLSSQTQMDRNNYLDDRFEGLVGREGYGH